MISGYRTVRLLTGSALLEMIRRREFYVVLLFMALFFIGILIMRFIGVQNSATASFLLNLGMSLAYFFSLAVTLITSARQYHDEVEHKTIFPLLAKPVSRTGFIIGKWVATSFVGILVLLVLNSMAIIPVPRLGEHSFTLFIQTLLLEILSLVMLSAVTLCVGMYIPKMLNCVIIGCLVLLLPKVVNLVQTAVANPIVTWLIGYIPNFSIFNTITYYTSGSSPLNLPDLISRILYGMGVTFFFLMIAARTMDRKTL